MIETEDKEIGFKCSDGAIMKAFLSRPKDTKKCPGIIVIQEIFGLNDQIRGVARRYAGEGYVVIAPHLFSRNDLMTEENIESAMKYVRELPAEKRGDPGTIQDLMKKMSDAEKSVFNTVFLGREALEKQMVQDLVDCKNYLQSFDFVVKEKLGITGFCMGGGLAYQLSTMYPFSATVPFYGQNPKPLESITNIAGPILAFYAGEDERVNSGLPPLVEAMVKYKKQFSMKIYKGAQHSFFNEKRPSYNKEAAEDAWKTSLAFFEKNLK
ncbi:MAG: dienelactone hydrolase family protein [Nitrososphaerales archaeon]